MGLRTIGLRRIGIHNPIIGKGTTVVPVVIPTLLTAIISNAFPTRVGLTFSAALNETPPDVSVFTLAGKTISDISISGALVVLTVTVGYGYGDTPTAIYTKPATNPLTGTTGGEVASFSQAVTNNIVGYPIGENFAVNFPENSSAPVIDLHAAVGSVFSLGDDAPAPTGITLTPDAVGANPVTWYWKTYYIKDTGLPNFRSLISEEGSFTIGDDTTGIAIVEPDLGVPFWADGYDFALGTVSGVYDMMSYNDGSGLLISPFIASNFITLILPITVKKIPTNYSSIPPAPTNISITPDAVGSNPVTWYYKVIQTKVVGAGLERTELSAENSYTAGDSTTELIFNCTHINYDTTDLFFIIKGTASGVYTNIVASTADPLPFADTQLPVDLLTGVDLALGEPTIIGLLATLNPFYLINYDNDLFAIDSVTGELTPLAALVYATPTDVNLDGVYDVRVKATLGASVLESIVSITVTDV